MTKIPETQQRLDRIEIKIDRLAEAIISLARAEEKLIQLEEDKNILMAKMIKLDERVMIIEKNVSENYSNLTFITRFFWIAMTAIAAAFTHTWFTSNK